LISEEKQGSQIRLSLFFFSLCLNMPSNIQKGLILNQPCSVLDWPLCPFAASHGLFPLMHMLTSVASRHAPRISFFLPFHKYIHIIGSDILSYAE
jgi:hypothetical protein